MHGDKQSYLNMKIWWRRHVAAGELRSTVLGGEELQEWLSGSELQRGNAALRRTTSR